MNSRYMHPPLKLVDIAISNARNTGQEPDVAMINFFWTIATRQLTGEELALQQEDMSKRNTRDSSVGSSSEIRLELTVSETIEGLYSGLVNLRARLAELHHSQSSILGRRDFVYSYRMHYRTA